MGTTKHNKKYINPADFQQDRYPVTFIIGARGVGKTIGALKDKLLKNYENKTMFIYLRRYQTEIDTASFNLKLLSELIGHVVSRNVAEDRNGRKFESLLVDNVPVCYLLSLSTASKYKSNDYSLVTEIVYDEFIDPRGRELKNETRLFLNFAMTVFRDFSKYKALFLANATNLYNCYFLDFEILPKYRITKFSKLGIKLVMYDTSEELYNEHKHSILGRQVELIEGANNSSLENNFDNQYDDFIAKLSKKAKYRATLRLDTIDYGLYQEKHYAVVSNKADLSFTTAFAMRMDDASDERPVIDYRQIMIMINNFKNGQLRFSDVKTRSQWLKFFKAPYANSSSI